VVGVHLERFAWREKPTVVWTGVGGEGAAGSPGRPSP